MSTSLHEKQSNPREGMLAIVRKRNAIISEVRAFSGATGVQHLVRLDYLDDHRPQTEEVIWELEPNRHLQEPSALPQASDMPMPAEDFDALVRAARWGAIQPFISPDPSGSMRRTPVSSPFHGAVQVEDYQLVPLLKALSMPRINLLIADDVGLGKTIEAGLILSELLIRRRIQRVLILTPASLRLQWQRDELWSKFSLPFEVVDRDSTQKLRRTLGFDANPWRSHSRIISSYHYLRQPDVRQQFHSASRLPDGSAQLPWDLLIVDEVHNLMPSPFGEDSDLCKTLREIAPLFEHRLFLTATPHNGHTRSFTGLLEMMDPVRFSRTDELRPAERERVRQVVIRRLKREINERSNPPKFCARNSPQAVFLDFEREEKTLIKAFGDFRSKIRSIIAQESRRRKLAGRFAIEILGKRLLSGPVTFADSWWRCKLGLQEQEAANDNDLLAAQRDVTDDTADDRESEQRLSTATTVIGTWLKPFAELLSAEIQTIDLAVQNLNISLGIKLPTEQNPSQDARFAALLSLIRQLLMAPDGKWRPDERLIVFTEYKTTLDYLLRRLRAEFPDNESRILCLFGGMDGEPNRRELVKERFNDPQSDVRILIATDAASEGINLQSTARYLLHFDCPWNPSRLEQRNGRLDRHGQPRDVTIFHFASDEDADVKFIGYLINKVDQIREDLGATGELFDEATHRCLIEGADLGQVQRDLDIRIESARKAASFDADRRTAPADETDVADSLTQLAAELDLDESSQHDTLESAMAIAAGRPQLSPLDPSRRCRIVQPLLSGWSDTIDETVRRSATGNGLGSIPYLAFSATPFIQDIGGRPIFRPRIDTQMIHLGHPLMKKTVGSLTRRRFPGSSLTVSRWTVRLADIPSNHDALILLHLEELAVNQLRETFHHWIRTVTFPVQGDELLEPLAHKQAVSMRDADTCQDPALIERGRNLMDELVPELQDYIRQSRARLTENLTAQLSVDGQQAREEELDRYQSRQGEVSTLIAGNSLLRLEREIADLKRSREQGLLFEAESAFDEMDRSVELKQEELERRRRHYEEVRDQLTKERERVLNLLLPKRYAMQGEAQVFPVAVEIRLPRTGGTRS